MPGGVSWLKDDLGCLQLECLELLISTQSPAASLSILMEMAQVQEQTSTVVQVLFQPLFAWHLLISHCSKWVTQPSSDSNSVSTASDMAKGMKTGRMGEASHFCDLLYLWSDFHIFIDHLVILFGDRAAQIFPHFPLSCQYSYYWFIDLFLDLGLLRMYALWLASSSLWTAYLSLKDVFWKTELLNFISQFIDFFLSVWYFLYLLKSFAYSKVIEMFTSLFL